MKITKVKDLIFFKFFLIADRLISATVGLVTITRPNHRQAL